MLYYKGSESARSYQEESDDLVISESDAFKSERILLAIAANRAAATAGFSGPGSPDGYPFASTYEGGAGAFVSGVPLQEQHIQGGVLFQFYKQNNFIDGSKFKVQVK